MVSTMSGPSSCVLVHAACSAVYPRQSAACRMDRFCRARHRRAFCGGASEGAADTVRGGGVHARAYGACGEAYPHEKGFDWHRVVSLAHFHKACELDLFAELPSPFGQCRVRVFHCFKSVIVSSFQETFFIYFLASVQT